MAGFPTRPSLAAFGPTMVNRGGVRDPSRDAGAALFNLLRWQAAGAGSALAMAWAAVRFTGPSTVVVTASGHAAAGGSPAAPTPGRTSQGLYTVVYPATMKDLDGNDVPTALLGVLPAYQGLSNYNAVAQVEADGRTVTVKVYDNANALQDGSFFIAVY